MISNVILPLLIIGIVIYASFKINVYDSFIEGVKESYNISLKMFPTLLAMILGVNILINCGLIELLFKLVFNVSNIPVEPILLGILRPISGGSSLALLNTIYLKYGPDSIIGIICSVLQGSSDTTLYIITLYFGSIGIKKIRYALKAGLISDLLGIIVSIIVVLMLF